MGAGVMNFCRWFFSLVGGESFIKPVSANGIGLSNGAFTSYIYQQADGVFRINAPNVQFWNMTSLKLFTVSSSADLALQIIPNVPHNLYLIQVSVGDLHLSTTAANTNIRLSTVGDERMRIDEVGDVSIGTTTATDKFHVEGGNIKALGTTGQTFKVDVGETVPAISPAVIPTDYIGTSATVVLTIPTAWILFNVAGVEYKVPAF